LNYILNFKKIYGDGWTKADIAKHVENTLKSGKVIPGYGHAVLRKTDPRFMCELDFAKEYIKDSNLVDLVKANYEVIPEELKKTGKITNPWPNVDAGSGALLMHYGMT
jgi:citrate synthase